MNPPLPALHAVAARGLRALVIAAFLLRPIAGNTAPAAPPSAGNPTAPATPPAPVTGGSDPKTFGTEPKPSPEMTARHLLFIGNSLTYRQQGIYTHLEKLASSSEPPIPVKAEKCVKGGATLKTHWERPEPREMIARAAWSDVVLQEDLPEINVSYFREYARRFVAEVRKANARPILLMTWPYERLGWIDADGIAEAHRALAKELGVEVAPVALAWKAAMKERPGLDLLVADREHPSLPGTYLATCVVFATVYGMSPENLPYVPEGMDAADARYLRKLAWSTVRDWRR